MLNSENEPLMLKILKSIIQIAIYALFDIKRNKFHIMCVADFMQQPMTVILVMADFFIFLLFWA